MATQKWRVTHDDGRVTVVCARTEAEAKKQANHQETTRVLIAVRRGLPSGPDMSVAVSAVCLEP